MYAFALMKGKSCKLSRRSLQDLFLLIKAPFLLRIRKIGYNGSIKRPLTGWCPAMDKPVVVDVWADWCGPCKMLAPQFKAAAEDLEGKARFVKLDADRNKKLAKKYRVMSLPTLLFLKDGQLVDRVSGVVTKTSIVRKVKPLLNASDQKELKKGFNWKFWS